MAFSLLSVKEQELSSKKQFEQTDRQYEQSFLPKAAAFPAFEYQLLFIPLLFKQCERKDPTKILSFMFYSQQGWSTVDSSKCVFVNNCQESIFVEVTKQKRRKRE